MQEIIREKVSEENGGDARMYYRYTGERVIVISLIDPKAVEVKVIPIKDDIPFSSEALAEMVIILKAICEEKSIKGFPKIENKKELVRTAAASIASELWSGD